MIVQSARSSRSWPTRLKPRPPRRGLPAQRAPEVRRNHFYFRYVAQETAKRNQGDPNEIVFLEEDDSWTDASYTAGRYHYRRRELFGVPPV